MKTKDILRAVQSGRMTVDEGADALDGLSYEDMGFARLDTGREVRSGFPEVIFCAGKSEEQLAAIYEKMLEKEGRAFGTRASQAQYEAVRAAVPSAVYDPVSRILRAGPPEPAAGPDAALSGVCVATAGTSDIPVAEEAAQTAAYFGCAVDRVYDVGVSGLHRLLSQLDRIRSASCVVAVAGMEGALASVIGGLVQVPVIAVPTSVGYGASMGGLSALLTMINSCANGVTVVNIDNGYGAGYVAAQIVRLARAVPAGVKEGR